MYNGGKNGSGVYQTIINQIPPHRLFIELFLGSGAISNYKKPADFNIGIEINRSTIDKFTYPISSKILNIDALTFLGSDKINILMARVIKHSDTFIYADPPYPKASRRSDKDIYDYEFTDEQHIELLTKLKALHCNIAISTYPNDLYTSMLQGWRYIDFTAQTRAGKATERLYMNYKQPKKLHDYKFLGKDFTDRQRIQRKIKRHVEGLLKLQPLERQAIIQSIAAAID